MRSTRLALLLVVVIAIAGCGGGTDVASGKKLKAFAAGIAAENHTSAPFYTALSDFGEEPGMAELYEAAAERRAQMSPLGEDRPEPPGQ